MAMSEDRFHPNVNYSECSLPRYIEVDSIKGLAIIGIVVTHMNFNNRFNAGTLEVVYNLQILFGWCVLAFFFCSGLLAKPLTSKISFAKFIKKRFLRLVVPCLVFSISYKFILTLISWTGMFSYFFYFPEDLFGVARFIFEPVGPQFYFLYYLFIICTAVAIFERLTSTIFLFVMLTIMLPVAYKFIDTPTFLHGPDYALFPVYFFSYVSGYSLSNNNHINKFFIFSMPFISVNITIFMGNSFVMGYIFVPFVLWIVFRKFPLIANLVDKTKIGKYSAAIYVWHAPITLPFISIICVEVFGGGPVVIFPVLVCTILACCIMHEIVGKFSVLRLWRF